MAVANLTAAERTIVQTIASALHTSDVSVASIKAYLEELGETVDMDDLSSVANGLGASLIGVEDAAGNVAATDVEAAIAEIYTDHTLTADLASAANAKGASLVGVEDAGTFTTATDVEAALAELYQHILTTQASILIPMGSWFLNDGTALTAEATAPTPGYAFDGSEAAGIKWGTHATPTPICTSVLLPYDLDATADVTVNVLAYKSGATVADAVTWTITAFIQLNTQLYDSDTDLGGVSSAMTGDAAAKTCQLETLALAAGDIPAVPAILSLSIQPTDGTLDTDDVTIVGIWLTYTRKLLIT